jgi:quercetin dioxygenase-like cupin family protein
MRRLYILMFVLSATLFAGDHTKATRGYETATNAQDPLVVNSSTIALKLENARVRVLEATLKPGDKEKTHSHPAYVIYVIEGGKVRTHGTDGSVTEAEFKTGAVIYREAVTHWAENIGNTTIRLELVELKQ